MKGLNINQIFNGRIDLFMMSMNLSDIAILSIKSTDYCCVVSGISKIRAVDLMQNIDLTKKSGTS